MDLFGKYIRVCKINVLRFYIDVGFGVDRFMQ